jgi:hypothetical protein
MELTLAPRGNILGGNEIEIRVSGIDALSLVFSILKLRLQAQIPDSGKMKTIRMSF